jgi:hypothetical protein
MAESTPPDRIPITIEITPEQKRRIEQLAEQQGVSLEDAVRQAIEHGIAASASNGDEATEAEPGSFLEATRDLAGSVVAPEAPPDLSSNPEHMEGYGQ